LIGKCKRILLELTVTDNDPQSAAIIANSLLDVLIAYNESLQVERFASSEESLKVQISQIESQIQELELSLGQISQETIQTQLQEIEQRISELTNEIQALENQERDASFLKSMLNLYGEIYVNILVNGETDTNNNRENQIQSNLALYQQIHTNLLNNYENIRLERLRSTPNVVQIEVAPVPTRPIRPQPLQDALLAADPDARVWLGGLIVDKWNTTDPFYGKPENFLRGVLAAGAAPYFDVVPYHGHTAYYGSMKDFDSEGVGHWAHWGGAAVGKPRFLRSIMQDYGVDKILSIDEVGVGCIKDYEYCNPPTNEFYQFQASLGMRYAIRVVSENVESFIWYTLNSPSWRNMGLLYLDGSPRPVFYAYQNLISLTEGLPYSHMVDYGDGIETHEFRNIDTWLQVIWTDIDEEKIIQIPKDHFQAAIDRDGNPITVGGDFEVTIGFAPIYLAYSR